MEVCECGGRAVRIRRSFWQKLKYQAVYRCKDCARLMGGKASQPMFSGWSVCPRCGTRELRVRRKRDNVDSMSHGLLSRLEGLLGAALHHCEFCRLQFYDFRPVAEKRPKSV